VVPEEDDGDDADDRDRKEAARTEGENGHGQTVPGKA
jgi:hypothetical protein